MSLPYDYYPAVLYAIEQVGQGRSMTEACGMANISIPTFKRYTQANKDLGDMFIEAEQQGHDAMADALLRIDNNPIYGTTDPKMAKIFSDNIKWFLAKKRPDVYGEKVTINQNVSVDVAITTALDAARRRVALPDQSDVVDAVLVEQPDEEIMTALLA